MIMCEKFFSEGRTAGVEFMTIDQMLVQYRLLMIVIYDLWFMRTHLRCIKCLITHFCFAQIFMWNSSKGERTFDFWIDDRVESVASRKTQYLNMGLIITRGFLFLITNHSTIVQRVSFNMKSARVWSSAVYLFSSNQIECVMAGVLILVLAIPVTI